MAMIERGWHVTRVELSGGLLNRELSGAAPAGLVDVIADVRTYVWPGPAPPDLVWASPPCTQFSRTDMPWHRSAQPPPDMHLLFAALGHVATLRPAWWAVENVRGAIPWFAPWLGPPTASGGPVFLWGRLPPLRLPRILKQDKHRSGGLVDKAGLRSRIPYAVSLAVAEAIERAEGRAAA